MTDWVVGVVLVVIGLADWFFATSRIPPTARRVQSYSWRLSAMPFAWGVALGRVFAPPFGPPEDQLLVMVGALVGLGGLVGCLHYVLAKFADVPNWFSLIYVPCGVLPGMLLWPVAVAGAGYG
jgi:hypothetical protein